MAEAAHPTRERILDAAASVVREHGLARATTRRIAAAAGCSEALLYKHFASTQEIYLAVLRERAGVPTGLGEVAGSGEVRDTLIDIVEGLMDFYVVSFPMSVSVLASRELLAAWREGMTGRGAGPRSPVRGLERYLRDEMRLGRLAESTDAASVATLLCGAAFQQAFLAVFDGLERVPGARRLAEGCVDAALPDLG